MKKKENPLPFSFYYIFDYILYPQHWNAAGDGCENLINAKKGRNYFHPSATLGASCRC